MLVDENGGTSDSLATPKSSNHTKSSENTGRWRPRDPAQPPRARTKRSLEPLDLLDGGGIDRISDGTTTVHDDPPVNRFVSRTLNARTNNALPQQMYVAMMAMASKRQSSTPASSPTRRHRKRQAAADVVVYRKESDDVGYGEIVDETVNIVPLDSEHRIRVNLTIASDDSAGSPMYSVSLSLPSVEQQPKPEKVPSDITAVAGGMVQQPSLSAGTECECFCPCLEQDDDDDNADQTSKARLFSTTTPSTIIPFDNETSSTFWITSSTTSETYSETSEPPEPLEVSCPPPVLLFCDSGKRPPVYILGYDHIDDHDDKQSVPLAISVT